LEFVLGLPPGHLSGMFHVKQPVDKAVSYVPRETVYGLVRD